MEKFIDLTHEIDNHMPSFIDDVTTELKLTKTYQNDGYNYSVLHIGLHTGTHIDTPMHMTEKKNVISEYSLDNFVGPGKLINVIGKKIIDYQEEYEKLITKGDIVLIHTGHSQKFFTKEYFTEYPKLSQDMIDFFISKKIKMLGLDTPSPDYYPYESHIKLFRENILIIENLCNLDKLLDKTFTVIALPIKIKADSAIARVIAYIKK
ncbi:MAG TPA: cyclase family protein [Haloplasmataceae bacterium]